MLPHSNRRSQEPVPATAGIGLRHPHHRAVIEQRPAVGWLEVHSENYLDGVPLRLLQQIRRDYPVSLHGVGLSLGTDGPLDRHHLSRIKDLADRIEPGLISEHLAWSVSDGVYLNDLLPLPYTEEALDVFCDHVDEMQAVLRQRILVENPSSYLRFTHSTIAEWDFIAEIARRTGCGVLLDVNNIHVSARNHGFDAQTYLDGIPRAAVCEIHLAGHAVKRIGDRVLCIDDHGSAVAGSVWTLYAAALARFGRVPTLIEWDANIPELPVLLAEAAKADGMLAACPREAGRDAAA